ncbi:hypothetical protein STEG23_012961 [Scotinomys teguina]
MPFNRRMDKENVVHIHNGVLRSRENNDIMKFAGKWMELENVILSEHTVSSRCEGTLLSSDLLLPQYPSVVFDTVED